MVQKAKRTPTATERLQDSLAKNRQLFALNRFNKTAAVIGTAEFANFGGSAGGVQAATGNYLRTKGDTMVGPIAYFPTTVSINGSDELDITPPTTGSNNKSSSYVIASFATPDKIQKIVGAQFSGQMLFLQVPGGSVLTLEDYTNNATGNIITSDGTDVVITTTTDPIILTLLFDITRGPNSNNGGWVVLYAKSITGGSATASFPLSYPVDDQGSKTGLVTHSLTATTAHKLQFTATGDCNITITGFGSSNADAVDFYIEVTQDNVGGHDITFNDPEVVNPPTITTVADTLSLLAVHADGDGNMRVTTLMNAGATPGNFANRTLSNLTTPSLNTDLSFNANDATNIDRIIMNQAAGTGFGSTATGYQSNAAGDLNSFIPTTTKYLWFEAGTEIMRLDVQTNLATLRLADSLGAELALLETTGGKTGQIFKGTAAMTLADPDKIDFVINVTTLATLTSTGWDMESNKIANVTDPTLAQDVATKNYVDTTSSQTPWVADIDADGFDLTDLSNIEFRATTGAPAASTPAIHVDGSGDMISNVATLDSHFLKIQNVTKTQLSASSLSLTGVTLDMGNSSIADISQVQVTGGSGDVIHGFLSGSTGVFNVNSNANSSQVNLVVRNSGGSLTTRVAVTETTVDFDNPIVLTSDDPLTTAQYGLGRSSSGTEINAPTGKLVILGVNGSSGNQISIGATSWGGQTSDDMQLFCVTDGTDAPINLEPAAGDPSSLADGDMWYNSTSNKFRGRANGVSVDLH